MICGLLQNFIVKRLAEFTKLLCRKTATKKPKNSPQEHLHTRAFHFAFPRISRQISAFTFFCVWIKTHSFHSPPLVANTCGSMDLFIPPPFIHLNTPWKSLSTHGWIQATTNRIFSTHFCGFVPTKSKIRNLFCLSTGLASREVFFLFVLVVRSPEIFMISFLVRGWL